MNLDKLQKALFDAVSGIDEAYIDEAATPPNRVFPRPSSQPTNRATGMVQRKLTTPLMEDWMPKIYRLSSRVT